MIKKLLNKLWWVVPSVLLIGIYIYGYREMFFHQDDLDWFIMANRPFWSLIAAPLSDHINYIFRILLKFEWDTFHLYFPAYQAVSVLLHAIVIGLLYKLAKLTSGRADLAAIAAVLFSVNTNWTEVVLWTSGQTISITVVFVLLAMIALWKAKWRVFSIWLASLTSALALGLPAAAFLVYGINLRKRSVNKLGVGLILIAGFVTLMYYWRATDGTLISISYSWLVKVLEVMALGVLHTVIGRLIIPFDRWENIRLVIVSVITLGSFYKWRNKLEYIWRDEWSRFLILQIIFYYLVVAVGRAQYGVGIMKAERYAYLGLALLLLLVARMLRNLRVGRWIWIVPIIVVMQCLGFYTRARAYVVRPQQVKILFSDIQKMDISLINPEAYLPHFVLNDERLKYSDLMGLMRD